jgi:hypothetical protein
MGVAPFPCPHCILWPPPLLALAQSRCRSSFTLPLPYRPDEIGFAGQRYRLR